MANQDPILNHLGVYIHRAALFFCLWFIAFAALLHQFLGAQMTLQDWWLLFSQVVGWDCSPETLHVLGFFAVIAALPVVMIFATVGGWWRRRGIDALRSDRKDHDQA
jgi:hypothetical protein